MQAIDDFLEYGLWIGSLQEKLAGQACPFIRRLVVGPLEQSDNSGCHAVTSFWVEVAPTADDVVCYRVHRVFAEPRWIVQQLEKLATRYIKRWRFLSSPFSRITVIFNSNCA